MLVYPQLATGALSQYPILKHHRVRTIINTAADGTSVKLSDPGAETIEWQLHYAGLSDAELAGLQQFYSDAEGSLNCFTFLDPTANLLAWSNELNNAVWSAGPLLSMVSGSTDPNGEKAAWYVENAGAGTQELSQTLTAPGSYLYCLSVFVRSAAPTMLTLLLGDSRYPQVCGQDWRRITCTGTGDVTATSTTFGIELEPSGAVEVYGLQVETQAFPSLYKTSTIGGCYEEARLRDDGFAFTSMNVNCHNATVNIIHASHL